MNSLAPIVLFVYNRPDHTRRTLEALAANVLADASTLYVYADGPKPEASSIDRKNIQQTRRVLQERKWCKQVRIIESDYNQGLADSIVEGVTEVVNKHGKAIVLEDDIVTSPGFLTYMNNALSLYQNEDKVMHVSGFFLPVKDPEILPETFFYNQTSCWGWGTWNRSWKFFEADARKLLGEVIKTQRIDEFNIDNSYPFIDQLKANAEGSLSTWAVKWQASVFLQSGLCLHPQRSMIKNIGFDGTGVHCGTSSVYETDMIAQSVEICRQALVESDIARHLAARFYSSMHSNKRSFIRRKIDKLIHGRSLR